ncbi:TnpV protein [uncultured Ruminococcus sp.]|uniref:TnpV protein n=1 Tax=uncultured Ruminococcus sp. TaxID=165186 RepID=UPI0034A0443A
MARKNYLKEHEPGKYEYMMFTLEILPHLETVQTQAQEMYETLIEQKCKAWGVNEELKEKDWLKWVQLANNARDEARQTVLSELILVPTT